MGKSKKNTIKNDYTNLKNLNLPDLISNLKTIKNIIDLSNYLSIQLSNLNIHSPTLDYSDYLLPFHNSKKSFYNGPLNYCKQDYILELSNFINNLQKNIISNNLLKLSTSFIEDQKKASLTNLDTTNLSIAQQLLIQIISKNHPDLFFCLLKGEETPVYIQLLNTYQHNITTPIIGNSILWICAQQTFVIQNKIDVHPKAIEVWFHYFYPFYPDTNWSHTVSTLYARECCRSLVRGFNRISHPKHKLPLLTIATLSALLNHVFLPSDTPVDVDIKHIYYSIKHLIMDSEVTTFILETPSQMFTTLISALKPDIDTNLKYEILSILVGFMASKHKPTSDLFQESLVNTFTANISETGVLIDAFLKLYAVKVSILFGTRSALWNQLRTTRFHETLCLLRVANRKLIEQSVKHEQLDDLLSLELKLKKLIMVSKPSRTWGSIIKRYFHTLLNLLFFYFMFYSLVYVQCDPTSSRTCPLPFDPQTAIQTTYEKTSTFIETTYHNTLPLIGNGIQYAHTTKDHIWDYCNPYYKTKIKPVWDTTILPKLLIIQQTSLYRNLKLAIFDPLFIPYLKIYEISESKILETQTDADYMKGRELQLEFLNTCHEYSSRLGLFWHTQAVYFIDQVVPFIMYYVHLGIRIFVSSVNTTCRWIRKEWMGNTTILLQVRDRIIRYVYTHPLYEVVAGRVAVFGQTQIGKDLALVGGLVRPYLEMGGVMVVHIVDEVWKFLEGRPSLVPKVWETLCVLLYQFFNRYF